MPYYSVHVTNLDYFEVIVEADDADAAECAADEIVDEACARLPFLVQSDPKLIECDCELSADDAQRRMVELCAPPQWSRKMPSEPGWYWFYGWDSRFSFYQRINGGKVRLHSVHVRLAGSEASPTVVRVVNGEMMWANDDPVGLWLRMDVPSLPVDEVEAIAAAMEGE